MNNQDQHGGGFFNGFLLGAIIGAAVVFFLFTDKGKKLLRTIMEEGSEGFQELRDLVEEEMEEEEEYEEEYVRPHLASIPHKAEHSHVEPIHAVHHPHADHNSEHSSGNTKRFFKKK